MDMPQLSDLSTVTYLLSLEYKLTLKRAVIKMNKNYFWVTTVLIKLSEWEQKYFQIWVEVLWLSAMLLTCKCVN